MNSYLGMSPEDFSSWADTLGAQRAREAIRRKIREERIRAGSGGILEMDSVDGTALRTARVVGKIDGMKEVLETIFGEDIARKELKEGMQ